MKEENHKIGYFFSQPSNSRIMTSVPTGTGKPVEDGTEQTANGYGTFQTHSVEIIPQTRKPVSANYPSRFKLPAISVVPYKYRYHLQPLYTHISQLICTRIGILSLLTAMNKLFACFLHLSSHISAV